MAAVRVSTFHRHFKEVKALSPLQYESMFACSTRSLLTAGEGNPTAVAFGVGYETPTRLAGGYARQSGPSRSKDMAR